MSLFQNDSIKLKEVARFMLDSLPFYAMVVDEDHRIVIANERVVKELGKSPDEIEGTYCPKTVHGVDEPYPYCPLEESVAKGCVYAETEFFDETTERWYVSVIYPIGITSEEGRRLFLHFTIDITDRKVAEKLKIEKKIEKDKYRAVFENTVSPMAIMDRTGNIIEANPSFAELIGFNPLGEKFQRIFNLGLDNENQIIDEIAGKDETVSFEWNTGRRTLIFDIIPAKIGDETRFILVGKDLTEILRREKLLQMMLSVERELDAFSDLKSLLQNIAKSIVSVKNYRGVRIDLEDDDQLTVIEGELKEHLDEKCPLMVESLERKIDRTCNLNSCTHQCRIKEKMPDGTVLHMAVFSIATQHKRGTLTFFSSEPLDPEEHAILRTMVSDIVLAIKNFEFDLVRNHTYRKVEESMEKIAILIDRIRNPLTVISALSESIPDAETGKKILEQVERINGIIRNLDEEWKKSDELRKGLRTLLK